MTQITPELLLQVLHTFARHERMKKVRLGFVVGGCLSVLEWQRPANVKRPCALFHLLAKEPKCSRSFLSRRRTLRPLLDCRWDGRWRMGSLRVRYVSPSISFMWMMYLWFESCSSSGMHPFISLPAYAVAHRVEAGTYKSPTRILLTTPFQGPGSHTPRRAFRAGYPTDKATRTGIVALYPDAMF